ncbi:hypothetical protein AB7M42_002795 [Bradyrhizobium diazoefficiens]|uniref:Uncharacterized protein n=1 Tax=Bradyrhizobium diazoefficiens TaxID=1355477 RepID=A0A809ZSH8_9BRAD|nr:hypothetical protein [Bradyrhizobium diazoefficiens]MBP1067385.1 hypothetical protein [Bradyrhizobium japonicum]BBZ93284.1 hypothetical protein F07S3_31170 [Bradyrhizobium diazoefficiens]BCA02288.1 hypothetical protein H12S4_31920 [Bradyrhizobium diazoefficiens]BCA11034.1 hypothetical protein BDHF08_28810 [Bradyrhizobium diazoefficiens]BCA19652.1 hypothetical protein BDHH15_28670 [Bradyrhizobium diazoefficiens]
MSIRLGVTTVAAALLFWPVSSLRAGGSAPTRIASPGNPPPTKFADLFRQAPIGHRQPRPGDLSEPVQATLVDVELRRLDAEIDRKLIICRGC